MVEVKVNGNPVRWTGLSVHQEIGLLCTEVRFFATALITRHDVVTVKTAGGELNFRVVRTAPHPGQIEYVCYPQDYVDKFMIVFPSFVGDYDTQGLLSALGIPCAPDSVATRVVHWDIHEMQWADLSDHLVHNTSLQSGDAPFVTVDLTGKVRIGDLKSDLTNTNSPLVTGHVVTMESSVEWMTDDSNDVDIIFYTEEGPIRKNINHLQQKYNLSKSLKTLFTSKDKMEMYENFLRNKFFRKYFTSETLEINDVVGLKYPVLGQKITFQGMKVPMVIKESTMAYNTDGIPSVNLVLCSPPKEDFKVYE